MIIHKCWFSTSYVCYHKPSKATSEVKQHFADEPGHQPPLGSLAQVLWHKRCQGIACLLNDPWQDKLCRFTRCSVAKKD